MKLDRRCALVFSVILMTSEIGWSGINQWTSLGPDGGGVSALVLDPQTPTTIYALTSGGIFRSTDSGANWLATGGLPPADSPGDVPISLSIDPAKLMREE